ncbi:MAG: M55 family metallopeptidase, partial [Candidatus Latescibacteria bacterium]|nr:M55 family metallopeptidase [Candidatus Latescibacterota bacterium]
KGVGDSVITMQPEKAVEDIRLKVAEAVPGDSSECLIDLPEHFDLMIRFNKAKDAYKASFYQDMSLEDEQIVRFKTADWMEVLKMIQFVL